MVWCLCFYGCDVAGERVAVVLDDECWRFVCRLYFVYNLLEVCSPHQKRLHNFIPMELLIPSPRYLLESDKSCERR